MTKHSVTDDGDLRKYFAAIPNVVCQLGLGPYELALYVHFKQAAGDDGGVCWKSRATIARESGMSAGMVTKARAALEMPRPELGGKSLITVREGPSKTGGRPTCAIRITDIWALNMSKFSTSPHDIATSPYDVDRGATSPHDRAPSYSDGATSPHDHKEKPYKKNPEEDQEEPFISKAFILALDDYEQHRKQKGCKLTPKARSALFKKLRGWGEDRSIAALQFSVANGWTGVFEEHGNGTNREASSQRNARNLRENAEYIRSLQNGGGEADCEDPIGLLASGV